MANVCEKTFIAGASGSVPVHGHRLKLAVLVLALSLIVSCSSGDDSSSEDPFPGYSSSSSTPIVVQPSSSSSANVVVQPSSSSSSANVIIGQPSSSSSANVVEQSSSSSVCVPKQPDPIDFSTGYKEFDSETVYFTGGAGVEKGEEAGVVKFSSYGGKWPVQVPDTLKTVYVPIEGKENFFRFGIEYGGRAEDNVFDYKTPTSNGGADVTPCLFSVRSNITFDMTQSEKCKSFRKQYNKDNCIEQ